MNILWLSAAINLFLQVQDPSAVPGLSGDTDGSQENLLLQLSKPLSASTSAARESIGPLSATSPAPRQSKMNQQHLSAITPKPAAWEQLPQPLLVSCSAGTLSGNPRQHADELTEAPPPDQMPLVLQCTSTVKDTLPSQVLETAPHSSMSNGSAYASPAAKRRRAAKSLHMMNDTPLAAADVAHSAAIMQGIPMMTVPDTRRLPDRSKPSPPQGLPASPIRSAKPANAHWPAVAGNLHQHAEPPMTSPVRPAAHTEAFPVAAAYGSSPHAAPAVTADGAARTVGDMPNPFQQGFCLRRYACESGLGCADSEVAAGLLIQEASGHQMCLTDDQFQPPRSQPCHKVTDLFATSSHSMEVAEASGAHYANQLRQQNLQSYPEMPDQYAIDLCGDDTLLAPVTSAENQERQAQIMNDERLARQQEMAGGLAPRAQHLHVS